METPTTQPVSPAATQKKAPLLVIIISWLMLISGAGSIISGILFGPDLVSLLAGVLLIAAAIGLRKLRRWSLYLITATQLIAIIYSLVASPTNSGNIWAAIITVLILAYLWSQQAKFTNTKD